MNIILLSGGSGKRLWPLSNDIRSKQFIKIFKDDSGKYESMLQRVYRQIKAADANASVTVATSKSQVSLIHNQLGKDVGISVEPSRRDTFPAIALAAAYIHEKQNIDENAPIVICPVDPYVESDYFSALKRLSRLAENEDYRLILMGINPTYPSEKYGYIIPKTEETLSAVKNFKEKPDKCTAEKYIAEGALWNSGVFACRLKYLLSKAEELIGTDSYDEIFSRYKSLEKISFDYAVAENEKQIGVMRFSGQWLDVGTWNTLTSVMSDAVIGDALLNDGCENVSVLNETDLPIICMGLKDMIVSASPEGILVSDKEQSGYIKPFVDRMDRQVMFAEKSWGSFRVIDIGEESLTIKVTLNPGNKMNYHSHEYRDETWIVTEGTGMAILNGEERPVKPGDVISMKAGCRHTVCALSELKIIEVQIGKIISISDKKKYDDIY